MENNGMSIREICEDLLTHIGEVREHSGMIRYQGYSRVLAVTKVIPRSFMYTSMFKVAENQNAVLILVLDRTRQGYEPCTVETTEFD